MTRRVSNDPQDDLVLMGRIGAAHGIKGEVRIQSFTDDPLAIRTYSPLLTERPGLSITISTARQGKGVIIARLADVNDRNSAEKLNGVGLFVSRDRLPPADDVDDFYHTDLIGLDARRQDGSVIGQVIAVLNFGAGDLIEIREPDGATALFPFKRDFVPEIDLDAGFLTIVEPEDVPGDDAGIPGP
jgi:16S rRNA processing protein RimM